MTITKVRLPRRAKAELAQAVIDELCRNLYAIDCQICGAALGVRVPALSVLGDGDVVHAMLHHETCAPPRWAGRGAILSADSFLSYHLVDLQVTAAFLGGREDGAAVDLPVVVVNPSLEAVSLSRDETGAWGVNTVDCYVRRGLCVGNRELRLKAVPDSMARLGASQSDSSTVLTVQVAESDTWSLTVRPTFVADIRRQRGVALVVTTAVDPIRFDSSRPGRSSTPS